jgi:hypothetical protein
MLALVRCAPWGLLIIAGIPASAFADEPVDTIPDRDTAIPIENRINLRAGVASSDRNGRPTICLDVRVAFNVGVESCGTGSGMWGDSNGVEMAHFRANYAFVRRQLERSAVTVRGGAGLAELQVGVDRPGLSLAGPEAGRGAVTGPELSLSAQLLLPAYKGVDFVLTGTAGVAAFRHADELVVPQSSVQPFFSIEAGVGW